MTSPAPSGRTGATRSGKPRTGKSRAKTTAAVKRLDPPRIVIVGRPNVGKSTLFNRLVGKRLALVDDTPGVTRDRREGEGLLLDLAFTVVDTAGLEEAPDSSLAGRMRAQTDMALDEADLALFVIDARAGVTPLDSYFAKQLREQKAPVIVIANKAEGRAGEDGRMEAFALGLGEPLALSAEHGEGMSDLYHSICAIVGYPEYNDDAVEAEKIELSTDDASPTLTTPLQLAIVGRPNAGKSTLINKLLGADRLVTGPEAGITRDSIAIDWVWTANGESRAVKLIDTAGMRKNARVQEKLEKLSVLDAKRAVDFAEVVVLLLDGTLGLESQDLRICAHVLEEGRALLIAINKWDTVQDPGGLYRGITTALEDGLSQVKGMTVIPISGHTGKNLDLLMKAAFEVRDLWSRRVPTSGLNRWFETAIERNPPPAPGGKRIKLRYISQVRSRPPTFTIWGNRTEDLPASYERYLLNTMREELGFKGVPIRIGFKGSKNPFDDKGRIVQAVPKAKPAEGVKTGPRKAFGERPSTKKPPGKHVPGKSAVAKKTKPKSKPKAR
jgi:GTPase